MIVGIGIDSVEIARIKAACLREGFMERIFTAEEIGLLQKQNFAAESVAGQFCAKEAASKAIGKSMYMAAWKEIEIIRQEGQPAARVWGRMAQHMEKRQGQRLLISITHDKHYATAVAVLEG